MDLSIIIVNWNSRDFLHKCIFTILENTRGVEFEILVIDNASFDGTEEMLQKHYPQVRFIQSDQNLGFAKANNEVFKISKGRYLLFLNPDTEIEGGAIPLLFKQLDSLPDAGIVGPKLLNTDMSIQTTCIRKFPTILNQVFDAEALKKWFPRSELWGMAPLFERVGVPTEVEAVSGASLMIKRSVFKDVERFSTDYFMYSEDIDLCYKVWKTSYKTYFIPEAVIVHHGGGSSSMNKLNTFSSIMAMESRCRFFQKTRSSKYCEFYRLAMIIVSIIRTVIIVTVWPLLFIRGKSLSIEVPLKKWIAIMRWALGLEKWAKKY